MASIHKLRHDIRERVSPQVSAYALAEFIISDPAQQDTILHNSRFLNRYVTPKNRQAIDGIVTYCANLYQERAVFEASRASIQQKSQDASLQPSHREEAERCLEVMDAFWDSRQIFGCAGLPLSVTNALAPLHIEGTKVSVSPDLLVGTLPPEENKKTGVIFIRPQKTPDPNDCKTDATKEKRAEYRREAARYMLVAGALMLEENGVSIAAQFDKKRSSVWDIRLQESIAFPSDWVSRRKKVVAACKQISRLWDTIEPNVSDLEK